MAAPSVYAAINAVTAELAKVGIAKIRINEADDYKYRSIDDVLDRLAPLLAEKRLCILPNVLEHSNDGTDGGTLALAEPCGSQGEVRIGQCR